MVSKKILEQLSFPEYYLKTIYSRGGKFAKGHPIEDRLVLCPLHEDKNPSMGFLTGKDGIERYHCFGCGAVGTVVDLHRKLNGSKDDKIVVEEIAKILGIEVNFDEVENSELNDFSDIASEKIKAIKHYNAKNSEAGFANFLREAKQNSYSMAQINRVMLNILWLRE